MDSVLEMVENEFRLYVCDMKDAEDRGEEAAKEMDVDVQLAQDVDGFVDDFADHVFGSVDEKKASMENELKEYLDLPTEPRETDPLKWWQLNKDKFPVLARTAKYYLAIPGM